MAKKNTFNWPNSESAVWNVCFGITFLMISVFISSVQAPEVHCALFSNVVALHFTPVSELLGRSFELA